MSADHPFSRGKANACPRELLAVQPLKHAKNFVSILCIKTGTVVPNDILLLIFFIIDAELVDNWICRSIRLSIAAMQYSPLLSPLESCGDPSLSRAGNILLP